MNAPPLHEYGIQNEKSDIRAHVGVIARTIFVFKTSEGRRLVEMRTEKDGRPAGQPGVKGKTAFGYPVPVAEFDDLRRVEVPEFLLWDYWKEDDSPTSKGALAVVAVRLALRAGRFPLWVEPGDGPNRQIDIEGTDVVVCCRQRIQVKCDYRAGDAPGCTGNLYLQTAECNPLKRY